jgi:class 3 adenylate cyclase/tetratricopeptide (TPR) repeat protein
VPGCPSCGLENPDGFRFCGRCGAALDDSTASFEERRIVTVLFADLVGFTSTAERLDDPEDIRRMLAPYYARLRRELVRVGGIVEKFIGDAVMAIFGAPVAHEDDPERAVRAALAIRDSIAELSEQSGGTGLSVRIGINTGEAIFALDVAHYEGERLVADFINVAARLQTAAPVDGILVGEATYRVTERAIEYRPFEPVHAKGKSEPVQAWQALGARSRVGVDPFERGRVPLVGRVHEVQLLCDAFAHARRESSVQLVTLVGNPGIGKSRLVFELQSVVGEDPGLVWWRRGACMPYGEGVTFWPLAEMVKAQAGILETDTVEEAERKLAEAVRDGIEREDEAERVEVRLRPLLGLAREGDPRGARLEEDFSAWRRFFEGLSEQHPLVMIFEDLHWADEGLLDFVDHLVDWATSVPLLVVCTARPELLARRSGWGGGKTNALTISLSPLSDDETARLLAELLEQAVMPAALQSQLLARAGGNPLYAEEFVRMLVERGGVRAGEELPLPESVQGIIAARLDVLAPEERAVLQDAAVIGRLFWIGALEHMSGEERGVLEDRLRSLERKQFVRRQHRSTVADADEYAFSHLLVRDVAYGRIPRARRAQKHELAAEWLETLARPEDQAEMLAHHYEHALELTRAAGHTDGALEERTRRALREAGDRASALQGYAAAARFYEAALGLWQHDDPEWPLLRFQLGRALFYSDEAGAEALTEARDGLLAAGDRELAAEAESMLGQLAFRAGEHDSSVEHYDRALGLLADLPASAARASVLGALARSLVVAAKSEDGLRVGREALALAGELDLPELRAKALITIGDARIELGHLQGMADYESGIALALEIDSPEAASGLVNLADTVMDLGELARSRELRAQAQQVAERHGDAKSLRWLEAELAGENYWLGDWDEALRIADGFIAWSEGGHRHYQEAYCRVIRGRIRLGRGDVAGALDDAREAVDFARIVKDPQALFPALAFMARALFLADQRDDALAQAIELLRMVRELRQTPVAYIWLRDLALVLTGLGRGADLVEALTLIDKATPWLEAAWAIASGEPARAVEIYARIGARPDEALARLRAAEVLSAAGRRPEAAAELERALDFFRSVKATAAIEASARLLAASA